MSKIKNLIVHSLAQFYDKATTFIKEMEANKDANADIIIKTLNTGESARLELNPDIISDTLELSKKQAYKSYLYSKKLLN